VLLHSDYVVQSKIVKAKEEEQEVNEDKDKSTQEVSKLILSHKNKIKHIKNDKKYLSVCTITYAMLVNVYVMPY
jgi:hypothetical protein